MMKLTHLNIPPLADKVFLTTKLRMSSSSLATVAICLDSEILSWFQSKGEEAEQHMAKALLIYAEAQKNVANMRQFSLTNPLHTD